VILRDYFTTLLLHFHVVKLFSRRGLVSPKCYCSHNHNLKVVLGMHDAGSIKDGVTDYIFVTISTRCPQKKQSQRIFSIILFRTGEILYNLENLFLSLLGTQLQLHFQRSLCNTLTWDVLFEWRLAELKQRLLVEWRKLDHSIVVAAISQWRRRLSVCVGAHGGYFEHILWCFHGSVS